MATSSDVTLTQRERAALVQAGVRVEYVTVAWMVVEAIIALGAGVLAGGLLLVVFGLDSVIELVSGGIPFCAKKLSRGS